MSLEAPRFSENQQLQLAAFNTLPLNIGFQGEAVSLLQISLLDLGFNLPKSTANGSSSPDGIYGSETFETVKLFQSGFGLAVDGVAGRQTLSKLDKIFGSADFKKIIQNALVALLTAQQLHQRLQSSGLHTPEYVQSLKILTVRLQPDLKGPNLAYFRQLQNMPGVTRARFAGLNVPSATGVDDAIILLLILILATGAVTVINGNNRTGLSKAAERILEALNSLTKTLSKPTVREIGREIADIKETLEGCLAEDPERLERCAEGIEQFDQLVILLKKKITTFLFNPFRFPGLSKTIGELNNEFTDVIATLAECLQCPALTRLLKKLGRIQ